MMYHAIDERGQNVGAVYLMEESEPDDVIAAVDDCGMLEDFDDDAEFGVAEFQPNEDKSAPRGFEVLDDNDELILELYPDGYEPGNEDTDADAGDDGESDDDALAGAIIDGEYREIP